MIQSELDILKPPTVSVCMITYAHEKYIEEAINGVLMQECDFDIELIVCNDCSPDDTDGIIQKILKNHPKSNIIKYINHKENLGMMRNFLFALDQCQGQYIALCEGDDFWTDKLKLQKQIIFLKNNPDCSLSFHNASIYHEDTKRAELFVKQYDKRFYNGEDILLHWLIPTASMVFVNVLKEKRLPDFFATAMHGDLALQLFLFEFGKFGVIDENMCTYRINESSVTRTFFNNLDYKYKYIDQLQEMKKYFKNKYDNHFNISIMVQCQNIIIFYKSTNLKNQSLIMLRMFTLDVFTLKKSNYRFMWQTFKIFAYNIINRINS